MPGSLTSNEYVHDLFFPPFAEIQQPFGAPADLLRPSAPFPYANSWESRSSCCRRSRWPASCRPSRSCSGSRSSSAWVR
ncbi:hypothetical protein [Aeromicrobium sp. UC242_57]|uniref:hypothetical protein n=1 Tax=Aeromicrobium sp. UC242_57 TaxID=3374624 RepID=UPI0037AD5872